MRVQKPLWLYREQGTCPFGHANPEILCKTYGLAVIIAPFNALWVQSMA